MFAFWKKTSKLEDAFKPSHVKESFLIRAFIILEVWIQDKYYIVTGIISDLPGHSFWNG